MNDEMSGQERCPVQFDHHSPEHAAAWPERFRELRETCPRAWSENHGGFWIASKYQDIIKIAQQPDSFSAHKELDPVTGEAKGGITIPPIPGIRGVPNETESPEWDKVRRFLNPLFVPKAIAQRQERARQYAAALIDLVIEKGEFDIVDDYTSPLPALVSMDMFGLSRREWQKVADPFHKLMYMPKDHPDLLETVKGLEYFKHRIDEEIAIRRKEPKDDLIGYLVAGEIEGEPLKYEMIHDMAFNIMVGGVDTTTAVTSNALLYLARNPEDRRRLIEQPELMPFAREEFIRYYTPVHGAGRNVKESIDVNGWHFQKGERVLLSYASANRDPEVFENPEKIILDRSPNRHIGFGAGMHRCIGSFLARLMVDTMLIEVLTRIPDYKVKESETVLYPSVGTINGWIHLPATFTPGKKTGAVID